MTKIIKPFEGLEIITADLIRKDGRGLVWHVDINSQIPRITLFHRCAGSLTGGHYHLPGHPTRDPELTLLIKGYATIYCKNIITKDEFMDGFEGPILFRYHVNVYHAMRAETDIWFTDLHDDSVGKEYNKVVSELHGVLKKRR